MKLLSWMALMLALGVPASAAPSSPAPPPATPAAQKTRVSTASAAVTTSVSGTVPLSAVPWGNSFAAYLKVLHDKSASQADVERARAAFESRLGASATTPTTRK